MNNASALFSVINGVYVVLGDSVCYAVWMLKCYRCSSLLSLILPLVSRNSELPSKALCPVSSSVCCHQLPLYGQLIHHYHLSWFFSPRVN